MKLWRLARALLFGGLTLGLALVAWRVRTALDFERVDAELAALLRSPRPIP